MKDCPPPVELFVGPQGHSVVLTHGFRSTYLICRDQAGGEVGRCVLAIEEKRFPGADYIDSNITYTTAGMRFEGGVLGTFLPGRRPIFSLHFAWGRRLLLDLNVGRILPEPYEQSLISEVEEFELKLALKFVEQGIGKSFARRSSRFAGSLSYLLKYRPSSALRLFHILECEDAPANIFIGSDLLPDAYYSYLGSRLRCALALRLSGVLPSGVASIQFLKADGFKPWPEKFPDRVSSRDTLLDTLENHSFIDTLRKLGVPDFADNDANGQSTDEESWIYFRGLGEETTEVILTWDRGCSSKLKRKAERRRSAMLVSPMW